MFMIRKLSERCQRCSVTDTCLHSADLDSHPHYPVIPISHTITCFLPDTIYITTALSDTMYITTAVSDTLCSWHKIKAGWQCVQTSDSSFRKEEPKYIYLMCVENVQQQSKHVLVKKNFYSKFLPVRVLSRPARSAGFLLYKCV